MSDAATFVPDGDPCTKHRLPTRLLQGATGLFSQCPECRDDFIAWYGDHTSGVERGAAIPEWRARQVAKPVAAPDQPQFELGVSV